MSDSIAERGHWPATASALFRERKYSRVVELCRARLTDSIPSLSGRLIYAKALFHADQLPAAKEQFDQILSQDPDNLVALKYQGDIAFASGDEWGAMANYLRILELDPLTTGLRCELKHSISERARIIALVREPESQLVTEPVKPLRDIPFLTETIGDLYLAQGHNRLAAEVFLRLQHDDDNPRLSVKLALAQARKADSPS